MLEKLDDIDWSELETSFGDPATDVPNQIRRLLDGSPEVRNEAEQILRGLLCNELIVGTATLTAIPFLLELLQSEETQDKQYILYILWESLYYTEATEEQLKRIRNMALEVEIGQLIIKGLGIYIQLLEHPEWKVRRTTIGFLIRGAFPRKDWSRINKAYEQLKKKETHPNIQRRFESWDSFIDEYKKLDDVGEDINHS